MKIQQILISIILLIILIIWYFLKKNKNTLEKFKNNYVNNINLICNKSSSSSELNDQTTSASLSSDGNCQDYISTKALTNFINNTDGWGEDTMLQSYKMTDINIEIKPDNLGETKSIAIYFNINKKFVGDIMTLNFDSLLKNVLNNNDITIPIVASADQKAIKDSLKYELNFSIGRSGSLKINGEPDTKSFYHQNNNDMRTCCSQVEVDAEYTCEDLNDRYSVSQEKSTNLSCDTNNVFNNLKKFNTEIPIDTPDSAREYKFWLYIKIHKDSSDSFVDIILNNNIKITIKNTEIFTDSTQNTESFKTLSNWNILSFDGNIAFINAWTEDFSENICNYYYCEKNDRSKQCNFDILKIYKNNNNKPFNTKEDCLKNCFNSPNDCNVNECQKKCLECRDINNEQFKKVEKDTYCPWTKNLISPPNPPDAPKIRGFADEKKINHNYIPIIQLEWRKPNSPRCKIERYIIEIDELGIGSNGIKIINVPQTDNNNTFVKEINNLSPQTTYKITVIALGTVSIKNENNENEKINLISKKSNVLTITTTGENNKILKQTYDYFDNENNNYSNNVASYMYENQTNNSDHILNNINHDDIDIYKSLINL